jgi:hypothetical protein
MMILSSLSRKLAPEKSNQVEVMAMPIRLSTLKKIGMLKLLRKR